MTLPRIASAISGAKCVRNSVKLTGACLVSSLLCVSVGCTRTPSSGQVQGANLAAPATCPVTLPNGWVAPGNDRGDTFHGNGRLWTALSPDGKALIAPGKDGSLGTKLPWWRAVRGRLSITGRRLDRPASPLRAWIPDGYGETGFQASAVYFPSEGCWEITGKAGDAELTFVVEIRVQR